MFLHIFTDAYTINNDRTGSIFKWIGPVGTLKIYSGIPLKPNIFVFHLSLRNLWIHSSHEKMEEADVRNSVCNGSSRICRAA